jgi:hypothetical protein
MHRDELTAASETNKCRIVKDHQSILANDMLVTI